jgi:4-carboxymuconolactone decarboxylase
MISKNTRLKWILVAASIVMINISRAETYLSSDENLNPKQQAIISIAALTAKGELTPLKPALHAGLDAGLTVNEIKEATIHLYAYAGFPRSIRGLQTLMTVLDERKAKGIHDEFGVEASPIDDDRSRYERGKTILEELTGIPEKGQKAGYAAFALAIEIFLKNISLPIFSNGMY